MTGSVRFGAFEFDPARRELRKHGLRIRVPDQSLRILSALVEHPGETVPREHIQSLLWPNGTVVGFEQSINAAVKRLREALGDSADTARFIERVPRVGYRFGAPLEELPRLNTSAAQEDSAGIVWLHYRLVERAGSGSMGEVWKADDTKLGRTVALKFVPQRLATDAVAIEAFRQEARHAASLNHPNICTIHGLEEYDGRCCLVMEYIDGQPLTAALAAGPLSVQRVVDVGFQTAEALAAAHAGGVIHRDVKPANLMLAEGGRVKLTDFGIATAVRGRESPPMNSQAHSPAGTLGYMSPEQARGDPVDARSDLFSLGAVLYEMATGSRPFQGDSPAAVLQAVLHQEPARPRALNPALPRELERVILKALEKDAAARWQNARAMAGALKRIAARRASRSLPVAAPAVVGVITVTTFAGWLWMRPNPVLAERDSIVIADFDNKTGDTLFDGALRQALLSQMGQSRYLRVVSDDRIRTVLHAMSRAPADRLARGIAREVCERAGGKAVLAGSIGALGTRYFIGLEAVGCADGESLGSEYVEAESKDRVLAGVTRAASDMRARLGESLASIRKQGPLANVTTPSLEALRAYSLALEARAVGNDPVPLLRHAIQLDPDFASAYFTLALLHYGRGQEAAAEEAVSRAYALRARASERERLAIEGAYHKIATGNALEGIAAGSLAAQLYPQDPASWRAVVLAYCRAGDHDRALEMARREVEAVPDAASYFDLAAMLVTFGRTGEATALLDKAAARGLGSELFSFLRYLVAALDGNSAAMDREAEAARGKPFERSVLVLQAQTAGFYGQLARARDVARNAAVRHPASAAAINAAVALTEATFGLERVATSRAKEALRLDHGRRTAATCALTFALTNESAAAEALLKDLRRRFPNDTALWGAWEPAVRGAIALRRGDARRALEAAQQPLPTGRHAWPPYIRGTADLRLGLASHAAAEFRKIIEWKNSLFAGAFEYGAAFAYPAAQVGLARALALGGDEEESRKQYEEFFALWKQADPDIPILVQARAEHAALARASAPIIGFVPKWRGENARARPK